MDYNTNKVDETVLALLHLTSFEDGKTLKAWKGMDWKVMDRLHEKGFISNPKSKVRSVGLTKEGAERSKELFTKNFVNS